MKQLGLYALEHAGGTRKEITLWRRVERCTHTHKTTETKQDKKKHMKGFQED